MVKHTVVFTEDATKLIGKVVKDRNNSTYLATFFLHGTFGGGTISWLWSPDGGTTKIPVKDQLGSAITSTAVDGFNVPLGNGSCYDNSDAPEIYATLAGSTNPALTVGFFDNN